MAPLTKEQIDGLSLEAQTFIGKIPWIPFPSLIAPFLVGPSMIPSTRKSFQATEDIVEESIIKKFNLKITSSTIANVPILIIEPPTIKPGMEGKVMLNIHGGGFVMCTARDRSGMLMAAELGIRVYSIEYSLSPEVKYPVARDQCLDVYREVTKTFNPKDVLGMSSSAGGQLMLSTLCLAQREKLPMIAGLVFYTPGADLSGTGDSMATNANRDVMHPAFLMGMVKKNYLGAGVDIKDPLVSPIYAEFEPGFPPSIISTGTRDLLLTPSINLYWKLREVSEKVELLVTDGGWHGFNWEVEMPEAVRVRGAVVKFVEDLVQKK